jgi:hypothetical protein
MRDIDVVEPERPVNYDGRIFRSVSNSASGDVGGDTMFSYHQQGRLVWATYSGGEVLFGTLVALASETGTLHMRYHHASRAGDLKAGRCHSTPELLADGRIRLYERWEWTDGQKGSGESVIEEVL